MARASRASQPDGGAPAGCSQCALCALSTVYSLQLRSGRERAKGRRKDRPSLCRSQVSSSSVQIRLLWSRLDSPTGRLGECGNAAAAHSPRPDHLRCSVQPALDVRLAATHRLARVSLRPHERAPTAPGGARVAELARVQTTNYRPARPTRTTTMATSATTKCPCLYIGH